MKSWTALYLLLGATAAIAQKPGEPSPEPPPPEPISMQIIGKREAVLDRGGRTAPKFRDDVSAGRFTPSPLSCGLKLRITNNTKHNVRIRATGSTNQLTLNLEGKGGVREFSQTAGRPPYTYVVLKPRESHIIPLTELAGSYSSRRTYPIPLEAGEYQLKASLRTYLYTDPPGAAVKIGAPGAFRPGYQVLTAAPVKITVKAK